MTFVMPRSINVNHFILTFTNHEKKRAFKNYKWYFIMICLQTIEL